MARADCGDTYRRIRNQLFIRLDTNIRSPIIRQLDIPHSISTLLSREHISLVIKNETPGLSQPIYDNAARVARGKSGWLCWVDGGARLGPCLGYQSPNGHCEVVEFSHDV